ncbi:MAG: formylglycine-generating enzyme family protein [Acidobacteria bacterium]|nr:formylglycine-generating enzyme family protein [Acidobacteriota bacterium]
MGADKSEYDDERPAHRVRVAAFNIGKYEVTQAQWLAVMGGKNPSRFTGDLNRPIETVSWNDAVKFCERLSQLTGKQFRLPTEAEWEYAARGGTTTEYSFGDDAKLLGEYAWFSDNSGSTTHPVGKKLPNQFGLFDMHGNVWEWCQDVWHDNYQGAPTDGSAWLSGGDSSRGVVRGGAWFLDATGVRAAGRLRYGPGASDVPFGFRVAVSARTP